MNSNGRSGLAARSTSDRAAWTNESASGVLSFWFDEVGPKGWFGGGPDLDRTITERYASLHGAVRATADEHLLGNADMALAAILVLDQFSRQIYRGRAEAFATDAKAVSLATASLARKFDEVVPPARRVFFYLPFEHAEDLALQDRAVALISALGDETYTRYAIAHRDVIARFGRFPHRNAALGRQSTDEERAYLAQPGSGF